MIGPQEGRYQIAYGRTPSSPADRVKWASDLVEGYSLTVRAQGKVR